MSDNLGQVEMGELIMVAIVVVLLIIVGLVGYSMFKSSKLEQDVRESSSLSAVKLAQKVSSLHEIKCSAADCIDLARLELFTGMESEEYYREKFGLARIMINQTYPEVKEYVVYDNAPADVKGALPVRIPVTLHEPVNKTDGFGYIEVVKLS